MQLHFNIATFFRATLLATAAAETVAVDEVAYYRSCPGDRGWWRDAWKSGDPAWTRLTVSIDQLPRLSPAEIARQKTLLTPNQFRQEFLLEFLDTDLQFYPTETIEQFIRHDDVEPLFPELLERMAA